MPVFRRARRALARAIVRSYPATWRSRYAVEVDDVIASQGIRWRDLADLLWCSIEEWSRIGPLHRALIAAGSAYVVGTAVASVASLAFMTGVAIIKAWLGLDPFVLFRRFDLASQVVGLSVWISYSALFAGLTALFCAAIGIGRRSPVIARVLTTLAFVSLTAWLPATVPFFPYAMKLALAAVPGLVASTVLFPPRTRRPVIA